MATWSFGSRSFKRWMMLWLFRVRLSYISMRSSAARALNFSLKIAIVDIESDLTTAPPEVEWNGTDEGAGRWMGVYSCTAEYV